MDNCNKDKDKDSYYKDELAIEYGLVNNLMVMVEFGLVGVTL